MEICEASTDFEGRKEGMAGVEAGKTVFVTVGTTSFDDLVRAVTTVEFREVSLLLDPLRTVRSSVFGQCVLIVIIYFLS